MADSYDSGFDPALFDSEDFNFDFDGDDNGGPNLEDTLEAIDGHNGTTSPKVKIEPGAKEPSGQSFMTNNEGQTVNLQDVTAPTPEERLAIPAPFVTEIGSPTANELNFNANEFILPQDSNGQFINNHQGSLDWSYQAAQAEQPYDSQLYYNSGVATAPVSNSWSNGMPNPMLNAMAPIQPMQSVHQMPQPTQPYYDPNVYGAVYPPPPNYRPAITHQVPPNVPPVHGPRVMVPGPYSLNSHGSLRLSDFEIARSRGPPSADPDPDDRDFVPRSARPIDDGNGNPLQNGKIPRHTRKGAPREDPEKYYGPPPPTPKSWGPRGPDGTHLFTYGKCGELTRNKFFTKQEMRWYLLGPTEKERDGFDMPQISPGVRRSRNKIRQGLTLWIGEPPAQSNDRLPRAGDSTKCRYAECAYGKNHTIRPGHFMVIFDEQQNVDGEFIDPYHNAGYAHLWCIEKCIDLVQLWRGVDIRLDYRTFVREEHSPFKINAHGMGSRNVVDEWWRQNYHQGRPQGHKRTYEDSLQMALTKFKVDHMTKGQKSAQALRGGNDISKHFNDPEVIRRLQAEKTAISHAHERTTKKRPWRRNSIKSEHTESESEAESNVEAEAESVGELKAEPEVAPEAVVSHNINPRLSSIPLSPPPTPHVRHESHPDNGPRPDAIVQVESFVDVKAEYTDVGVQFPSPPRSLHPTTPPRSNPPATLPKSITPLTPPRSPSPAPSLKRRRSDDDTEDEDPRPIKREKVDSDVETIPNSDDLEDLFNAEDDGTKSSSSSRGSRKTSSPRSPRPRIKRERIR
ncbi:hypothetical protein GGR57DRAFT_240731 [Xylariaceae sp. FL1272]|nr:hypothetical protein GGR57DRAFT_240731 [Xylariaceae sp. FL1272]